ncbi:Inositol polyphosphate 5-phosphatase [Toxocara canis]|uniref:Inositol polyphosphate 5-phosphatase n=1 Tax=Toxocara canis TaxID=6265 RepID=A0A0B2W5R2_TOXCA|nr:Inositol polyphosphate 5-phosphatase [Toxocara canis]
MGVDSWHVVCITYNVNARRVESDQIYRMLDEENVAISDIAVIALQELSHSELFGALAANSTWQASFSSWMRANGRSLLFKESLATNLLLVFARLDVFAWVDKIDSRLTRSSFGGLTGHKGTLAARIFLKGNRLLVFASSHLLPYPEGYEGRCMQYVYGKSCMCDSESDSVKSRSVVWLGDMNWRVDTLSAKQMFDRLNRMESKEEMDTLVEEVDQLRRAQRDGKAFTDFKEAPIYFAPTYRIIVGRTQFDAERVPSWCDRVLYRGSDLTCKRYHNNRTVTLSDHFPVIAQFRFDLSPTEVPHWNVRFEPVPRWFKIVPFTCRFSFGNNFWERYGSYRDWVGVFPSHLSDPTQPTNWLYVAACYEALLGGRNLSVAEFPCLGVGLYRLAYFSVNRNCFQGISDPFEVANFA